jgi:RNA polymerase sigma-70 factor, ECF subfamily
MTSGTRRRVPRLSLVPPANSPGGTRHDDTAAMAHRYEIDWSILMTRAQKGDSEAYRSLLEDITPYLRTLAARHHTDPNDIEDALQDIVLTIHAIRNTYDPTRPFGPWLTAIANRRLIDRLRRHGRRMARETALTAEHETFPGNEPNIETEISDRHELDAAVESLPASERKAIRLLKLSEMSLKEAAAVSGMSIAALKVATHRAVKHLRKVLSHESDDA